MNESLKGKTVLITGSTDGLGKLIAQHLAMQDAVVLLHGRDKEKGEAVLNELKKVSQNEHIRYYNGDFSSFQEVKALSENILKENDHLDILINNVGIGKGLPNNNKRELSKDGIELRFEVNYLSHVLLTENLLPILKPETSVIINVASVGQETLNFENLMLEKNYDGFFAYRQSKAALIMFTYDLAGRLIYKDIKVNAVHPASLMNTKMVLDEWGYSLATVEQGAEAVENLISTSSTGAYFDGKFLSRSIAQTYDLDARARLREITRSYLKDFLPEETSEKKSDFQKTH